MDLERRFPRYRHLLGLYPAGYAQEYGPQMLQTLADMLDGATSRRQRTSIWLRTAIDLPLSVARQQLIVTGDVLMHETPHYIKQRALIGAALLSPFLTFLFLDSITSHSLYGSWAWKPWVVLIWLIILPVLAFGISTVTFGRWLLEPGQRRRGLVGSLLDWRHSWPVLIVAAISIGIVLMAFFHDSVHCVVHNPIQTLRYWHTTWTCIRNG